MTTTESAPNHPFDHIALSLSGGGVRAVGYHLGTLDYLDRAGLLSQVHTLSTVSGGSLVGIGYALSLKQGESFQDFYDNLCEFLPELNTLEELLKVMRKKRSPVASGSRTLITAMAQIYHEKFFDRYYGDPQFEIFWEEDPQIHLKEIIFNATEFKTGIAFRFAKSEYENLIGNGKVWIEEEYARQIRMSDIMAASSCIPVAMEPLQFPQDFHWPDDPEYKGRPAIRPTCEKVEQSLLKNAGVSSIPLMDGGVYDNQGITSIILSVARHQRGKSTTGTTVDDDRQANLEPIRPHKWARWMLSSMKQTSVDPSTRDLGDIDLFIVSDTPIRKDPMYEVGSPDDARKGRIGKWARQLTIGAISWIVFVFTMLFAGGIFVLVDAEAERTPIVNALYILELGFLGTLAIAGVASLFLIYRKGMSTAEKLAKTMPPMERSMWSYAKTIDLGTLLDMATLRASSMSALTARIFMNRIRQLGYTLLYSHADYRRKVMDNNINDIKGLSEGHIEDRPAFICDTSEELEEVVERASTVGTKLWIDKPDNERHDLDVLIAAGHVSTCFNIIEYLWEFHRDDDKNINENVAELLEFAKKDWQKFNENPYWLVDERNNAGRDAGALFWTQSHKAGKWRWRFRRQDRSNTGARAGT